MESVNLTKREKALVRVAKFGSQTAMRYYRDDDDVSIYDAMDEFVDLLVATVEADIPRD